MPDYIMPHWSKYKGKDISVVPRSHLEWLQEEDWVEEKFKDLLQAIEEELEQRDRSYDTF